MLETNGNSKPLSTMNNFIEILSRFCYKQMEKLDNTYYKIIMNTIVIIKIKDNKFIISQNFLDNNNNILCWNWFEDEYKQYTIEDFAYCEFSTLRGNKIGSFNNLDKIIPPISLMEKLNAIL